MSEKRDVCIILLSPLNPLFSEENIGRLAQFAQKQHPDSDVIFMIADVPLHHNFVALGYPLRKNRREGIPNEDIAENRAKKFSNALKNKVKKAAPNLPILTFSEHVLLSNAWRSGKPTASKHKYYCDMRDVVMNLCESNREFRLDSLAASRPVINHYAEKFYKRLSAHNRPMHNACDYLFDELAAFAVMPQLLQDAFEIDKSKLGNIICIYPKSWPIFEKFFDGKYGNSVPVKVKLEQPVLIPQ